MKRPITILACALAAVTVPAPAAAQVPRENPYPAASLRVFTAAQTVTREGAMSNFFIPGSTVVFRAYAGQTKTKKLLAPRDIKSFYVQIPNQPNVKLRYRLRGTTGVKGRWRWTGSWTIPASYPLGIVRFRVLLRTKSKQSASFSQIPVPSSMLTVTPSVDASFLAEARAAERLAADKLDAFLYVDTVNGTRPQGARPRPVGCTQTTTFKRGEQLVFRIWGTEAANGAVLSTENVKYAYVRIPGLAPTALNWGPHGPADNRVWFWTVAWNIPPDFALGQTSFRVVFKTESNKFGMYDHLVTITP